MMANDRPVPARMLIIDDSRPYVESLNRDAQRLGIQLLHACSLEEGKELFEGEAGRMTTGVILDVKCLKEKRQEVPDSSFITAAIKYFGEKAPHLPLVVLTGEPDQYRNLSELYAGTTRVYSKGRDEMEMLAFLAAEAERLDWLRIVRQYQDVFAVCSDYLGTDAEQELLSCLRTMQSDDYAVIRNTLSSLRRLQERVYIAMHKLDSSLIPANLVAGEVNVIGIYKNLAERGAVERYRIIDRFAELIYKISSDNGAHTPYAHPKYPPTRYTVQAVTFATLDLVLWFGRIVAERDGKGET